MAPRRVSFPGRSAILATLLLLGILAAWQVILTIANPQRTVIPAPLAVLETLVGDAPVFLEHTIATAQEAILGFVIGCSVAISLALISLAFRPLEGAVLRVGLALYAAPIIVIAPLLVLWLGPGIQTRVAVSALACFFGVLVNAVRGFKAVSRESQELLHVLSANPAQSFTKVRLPSALPYLLSALKIAAAAAVLGAIIGEWVGANEGLGVVLVYSLFQFQVERLWAGMVLCTALALVGYGLVGIAERILIPWHESVRVSRLESGA